MLSAMFITCIMNPITCKPIITLPALLDVTLILTSLSFENTFLLCYSKSISVFIMEVSCGGTIWSYVVFMGSFRLIIGVSHMSDVDV